MSAERSFRVAVIGATGLIGAEVIFLLEERNFPVAELLAYESEAPAEDVTFRDETIRVEPISGTIAEVDVAFLCASAETSGALGRALADQGTVVIDLASSGAGGVVLGARDLGSIPWRASGGLLVHMADPLARLAAVPLRALGALAGVERVIATFLVPASGFGRERVDRLSEQTISLLNLREFESSQSGPEIAFRCVPELSSSAASTAQRVAREIGELLGGAPRVVANVVDVPVFYGQAAALTVELSADIGVDEARAALRDTPSVLVPEGDRRLTTLDVVESDGIFIVDLRRYGDARWLQFWALGDNVRQGVALPAVALAEGLLESKRQAPDEDSGG